MKYNSIGEQLIAKAQELDPSYTPDKFNDMSEAIDVILNKTGGGSSSGGDIWLDITPYLSDGENKMSISQEGYDLVYNAFYPDSLNPNNKYAGILMNGAKLIFNRLTMSDTSDKEGLNFILNVAIDGVKGYIRASIYNDKSVEYIDETDSSNKVWYELPNLLFLENITQEQFDEIKNLVSQNQLAGINCGGFYCPLTFYQDGQNISFFFPWYENDIFTPHLVILNTNLSVEKIPYSTVTLPQTAPTSQVIPSITTSNAQQNLTIGDGLAIENGELKTKDLEMAVSITATLDDLKNAVNSFSNIIYNESNKGEIISFIRNQKGIMKLTITTPVGNLYMTLRPSLWKDDTNHSYNFEGTLYIETDLSTIGGTSFNQIIVRAICWDNTDPVHFRPTIIPIKK